MKNVKEYLRKHYDNKKIIQLNNMRIEGLNKKLSAIEKEINNPIFTASLNTDLKAINYEGVSGKTGIPSSPMENEIEHLYRVYEKERKRIVNEICMTRELIYKLELETEKTDLYINILTDEEKELLRLIFKENMSITRIAFEVNMSKSSISRKLNNIYKHLEELIEVIK